MVSLAPGEAARQFDELVRRAERGETVSIVRDGKVIARLVPGEASDEARVHELLAKIDALRESMPPLGAPIRSLVEQGRRE